MRKFAISDIHGCQRSFSTLLKSIDFTKADELYLLGDYIDRGPDSKGVIDLIWQLQADGYLVHCLMGNHEEMLINDHRGSRRNRYQGDDELKASFNVNFIQDIPAKYIDWAKALPRYFEVDDYLLVHAGFEFTFPNPLIDRDAMLWIRNWYRKINHDWLAGRIIVHGHTPISTDDLKSMARRTDELPVIDIDNGCVFPHREGQGQLCALELGTNELTFQPYVG